MSQHHPDPPGVRFLDARSGREMLLVDDDAPLWAGWVLYRHPDGQWVSLRASTAEDRDRGRNAPVAATPHPADHCSRRNPRDTPLYEPCPAHNAAVSPTGNCRLCGGVGFTPVGLTVGQAERLAERERVLAGDPGVPAERRRTVLAELGDRLARLAELGGR